VASKANPRQGRIAIPRAPRGKLSPLISATLHELKILPKAKKALTANFAAMSEREQNAILKGKANRRTRHTVDGDGKENVC